MTLWSLDNRQKVLKGLAQVIPKLGFPVSELKTISRLDELDTTYAHPVLAMGGQVLEQLQAMKLLPKGRKITSLRSRPFVIPAFEPMEYGLLSYAVGIAEIDSDLYTDMLADFNVAARWARTGSLQPIMGDYQYVPDFGAELEFIKEEHARTGKPVRIAIDTETTGKDAWAAGAYFVTIQLSWKHGRSRLVYFDSHAAMVAWLVKFRWQLVWLLNTSDAFTVFANGKYDLNWFWAMAELKCANFRFDTTAVGSLLDENRKNSLTVHTKLKAPDLGGYDDCVTPDTRVCTYDLRWVPIGDVLPNDKLVGFDEQVPGPKQRRRLRVTSAVSTKRLVKPCLELEFSTGVRIKCSVDHGFLAHRSTSGGPYEWVRAHKLKVGMQVQPSIPVETFDPSYEAGYMGGLYDGEGYVCCGGNGLQSGLSQNDGLVWDRYRELLVYYDLKGYSSNKKGQVNTSKHSGWQTLRMLQLFRPLRLLAKNGYDGKCVPSGAPKVYVTSVTPIGDREVVSLTTKHHTFVAEGLCSHNSFNRTVDKAHMENVQPDYLLPYAGGDTDACLQVAEVFREELLADKALTKFYTTIMHPAIRAFEQIEQGGVLVDIEAFKELDFKLRQKMEETSKIAREILGGQLIIRHKNDEFVGGINLTKPALLNEFMFSKWGLNLKPKMMTESGKAPATSKEHLDMFMDDPTARPFLEALGEFRSASKTHGTYCVGFQRFIRSDGRLHPSYYLFKGDSDEDEGGTICLPAGELVLTNRGYLPVQQVKADDLVIGHSGNPRRVLQTVDNGVKPIVRVTLANGLTLRTTNNHEYLLADGSWVKACDLKTGMQATAHSDPEKWESIPGWGDFQVSSWGRVLNTKSKRLLTQYPKGKWGHLKVCLYRNGAQKRGLDRRDFTIHGLMADAFGLSGFGPEIRHLDGIAWDNTLSNLRLGSIEENKQDAVEHHSMNKRQSDMAKLTEEAVSFIRSQPCATRINGWTNAALAEKYGVCERLIRAVRSGARWTQRPPSTFGAKFFSCEVVSVEHEPAEPTYGMVVDVDHSHVTGGIVTHNTGRLSCRDPAFQTIPAHTIWAEYIRRCFPAPPGHVIVGKDYAQGELKIMACLSGDSNMLDVYMRTRDMHAVTGGLVNGLTYEQVMELKKTDKPRYRMIRQRGKAGNFGLIFEISADGFIVYARVNYGVHLTLAEAQHFIDVFFGQFPGVLEYQRVHKEFAHKFGHVRSPLGRVRHLPLINSPRGDIKGHAERQGINSPVQSTLTDMMIWALAIAHERGWDKQCPCFAVVHDQGLNYVPEDNWQALALRDQELMENLPFEKVGWKPQLKFTTDIKMGKNMGDMDEYSLVNGVLVKAE